MLKNMFNVNNDCIKHAEHAVFIMTINCLGYFLIILLENNNDDYIIIWMNLFGDIYI